MEKIDTFRPKYQAFLKNNISAHAFCGQIGMNESHFYYWQVKIRKEAAHQNGVCYCLPVRRDLRADARTTDNDRAIANVQSDRHQHILLVSASDGQAQKVLHAERHLDHYACHRAIVSFIFDWKRLSLYNLDRRFLTGQNIIMEDGICCTR